MIHTALREQHVNRILPELNIPRFSVQGSKKVWAIENSRSVSGQETVTSKEKAGIHCIKYDTYWCSFCF